ncbi:MAG: hydroxyacylglutathione hydrolase [Gammaproteobacteria bacterium]|nr:hydroxyacylglutathione hydrolase [Gammaproteobacteria bacterium]
MLQIIPIPAFADNYIWMLQNDDSQQVVLVDPGDERKIMRFLEQESLQPVAIMITHQHYDHTGGVAALVKKYPGMKVISPDSIVSEKPLSIDLPIAEFITQPVSDGDQVEIAELGLQFTVLAIPGHTLDHVAYYGQGMVFCGDTVFGCGCGRLFSGSAEQMSASMDRLSALPAETRMYCAHEYTLDNIGFARWVEPDNQDIVARDNVELAKQEKGIPTIPSTLELELKTNPFMRFGKPEVKKAAEKYMGKALFTDAEVFAAIRAWKDQEYD